MSIRVSKQVVRVRIGLQVKESQSDVARETVPDPGTS